MDTLRRYFVGNKARILSVRWIGRWSRYIPCNAGNAGGFYIGPLQVTWRKPYADCWRWNEQRRAWEIAQ